MHRDLFITTSIPYVNGAPHLGHALELVHVDALARHRRQRGAAVRVQSGTDDHALKNVAAAEAAGVTTEELVLDNGNRFLELARDLGVVTDEFVRTSSDPRHRAAVTALWRACHEAGDLYEKAYTGLYCGGCEQFYTPDELTDGLCPEHGTPAQVVTESNWFFRLSRHRETLVELIRTGTLRIQPDQRRNEVLGFLAGDVHDLSVSRPAARAGGWGVPVPDDPQQVVYVWFDALTNYITGLGYGSDPRDVRTWWCGDAERAHVVGKGIVRFHAVYWVAFLLSAGLPVPDRILVHDYLTVDGAKIAKSGAQAADPAALVEQYGDDALRWWLLREPAPVGTCDFTEQRLLAAYNRDLANSLGNLTSRTLTLAGRARAWAAGPAQDADATLLAQAADLPAAVDEALAGYDFRAACEAIVELAEAGNRFIEAQVPWHLVKAAEAGDAEAASRFVAVIETLVTVCTAAANELRPFVPSGAGRLLDELTARPVRPAAVFPRIAAAPAGAGPAR